MKVLILLCALLGFSDATPAPIIITLKGSSSTLAFVGATLPNATTLNLYTQSVSSYVSGGVPPYTFSYVSETGTNTWGVMAGSITGTPTNPETDTVTVKVTDSISSTANATFTIVVNNSAPSPWTFAPTGGIYTGAQNVAISIAPATGATIYYTNDGVTTPSFVPSELYYTGIPVPTSTTLQAIAYYGTQLRQTYSPSGIAAGTNFYHSGGSGAGSGYPPTGQFAMYSDQPSSSGSGNFSANSWNAGQYTGFTPNNPATAQLGYFGTGTSPTSTVQYEGNTVGAYLLASEPYAGGQTSELIAPEVFFSNSGGSNGPGGTTIWNSSSAVLHDSMQLEVLTSSGTGPWAPIKHFFNGQGAVPAFDIAALLWRANGSTGGVQTDCDGANALVLIVPLGATGTSAYITPDADSALYDPTHATWGTAANPIYKTFSYSISQAQVLTAINYLNAHIPGCWTGAALSTTISDYLYTSTHGNFEIQNLTANHADTMGWSMKNFVSTLLQTPSVVGSEAYTITGSSGPEAPSELIATQGGGPSVCNVNSGSGCLTNTAILSWPASTGATYYSITRNGTALGSGGCSGNQTTLTCTDATATNLNRVNTYGDETTYAYAIEACNASGCSAATTGAHWLYHGQAYNSCANYSGGGFGQYEGTTPVASFVSGSNIMTVTTLGAWTIFQGSSVQDASGAVPTSTGNSALGNPYILAYGTQSTTGTGGLGTYALSANATKTATADVIESSPGQYSQNGMEACPVTGTTELGHSYAMAFNWSPSGDYVQQYVASPGAVSYDMNIGDTTYSRIDVYTSSLSHGLNYTIHSRPGANASGTGDIYSSRFVELYNQSGASVYGTPVVNSWFTLLVPNTVLGLGTGQFTGYVTANWHGNLTLSGSTATLVSTADGSYANIANGDYVMVHGSGGWTCILATSTASGPTGTFSISGGCASGIGSPGGTNIEAYDAQVCASSATTSPGPDNAGLIQGNSEPDATYFGGGIIGFGKAYGANPNGVGTCTGTGNGHWGLFNGNSAAILTKGSSGSPLTNWVSRRTSIYKPEFQQEGGSGYQTNFVDMIGWQ